MIKKISTLLLISMLTVASAQNHCDRYDCVGHADRIITEDSRSWFFNRYDRGSAKLNNVWESTSGLKTKVKIDYTYNGGRYGWAELQYYDGEFQCIRYHDFPSDCRSGPKY